MAGKISRTLFDSGNVSFSVKAKQPSLKKSVNLNGPLLKVLLSIEEVHAAQKS